MANKSVPKHQKGRIKQRVSLTLDPITFTRLEALKEREFLASLSEAVRWLARTDETRGKET